MSLPRSRDPALLAVGLMLAGFASTLSYLSIPAFAEVLKNFPHLPVATSLLLRFYWVVLLLPLLVVAAWRFWPNRSQRGTLSLMAGISVLLVSQALVQTILYLPVFELGK